MICIFKYILSKYNHLPLTQAEVFPYPEIGNEEVEEINQLVAPVERFFSEEGERGALMNARVK